MTISSSQGSPLLCEGHPTRIHSPSYSPASFHHFWISKTASQKVPLGSCRNRCKIINVLGDCFQLTPRFFRWQTRLSSRFLLPVCIMLHLLPYQGHSIMKSTNTTKGQGLTSTVNQTKACATCSQFHRDADARENG